MLCKTNAKAYSRLRFSGWQNAHTLTVDGLSFQEWLVMGEDRGLWDCGVYEHNIMFLAGYDRGGSGRTRLLTGERATVNKPAATRQPKQGSRKISKKRPVNELQANPEEIELEEMSEVRRGKQKER